MRKKKCCNRETGADSNLIERRRTVMTFETERLFLRPWEESDAEVLYQYAKNI